MAVEVPSVKTRVRLFSYLASPHMLASLAILASAYRGGQHRWFWLSVVGVLLLVSLADQSVLPRSRVLWLYGGLLAFATFSLAWTREVDLAWETLYAMSVVFVVMWLVVQRVRSRESWTFFAEVTAWGLVVLLLLRVITEGLAATAEGDVLRNIEGKNALATYGFLGLLLSLHRLLSGKWYHAVLVFYYIVTILFLLSLKAVTALVVFGVMVVPAFVGFSKRRVAAFVTLVVCSTAVAYLTVGLFAPRIRAASVVLEARTSSYLADLGIGRGQRSERDADGFEGQVDVRREFVRAGIRYWKARPIIGHGPNQFRYLWNDDYGYATQPHNTWIELLVSFGVVGAVLHAWWLLLIGRRVLLADVTRDVRILFVAWFVAMIVIGFGQPMYANFPMILGLTLIHRWAELGARTPRVAQAASGLDEFRAILSARQRRRGERQAIAS